MKTLKLILLLSLFGAAEASAQTTEHTDTIVQNDSSKQLKGIEVVAQRPLIKSDIDKVTYEMADDPEAKVSSLLEMLRKVPMVTVDGEDNITVNGSSSFKIYVNGKPNNMMSNNPKQVLRGYPASSVKRIEVITNPGPKYDAEGTAGVINIVTTGSGLEGYNMTTTMQVGNKVVSGSEYATVKAGRLTLSANAYYNYNPTVRSYSGSERTATNTESTTAANIITKNTWRRPTSYPSGSVEASYEIDSLRLVSAAFSLSGGIGKEHPRGTVEATSPMDGSMLYRYSTFSHNKDAWYSIDGSIDYQRLFKVKGRMLTLSYRVSAQPDENTSRSEYGDLEAAEGWKDFVDRLENLRVESESNTTEHTFQIDYSTPIGQVHTIEAGSKFIMRNNKSNSDRYATTVGSTSDYKFDEENSSHYRHNNDILAAYAGYGLKLSKWSARLGLRYEHTWQNVKYLLGRGSDFSKNLDDVVPSIALSYQLNDGSSLRLGYNMRIYRPGIWYLNPYLNDTDPTNISQGNPNLDTEHSHSFDLGYNLFTSKFSLNFSARYSFTNNSIESITYMVNDQDIIGLRQPTGTDVLYTTYSNIGKFKVASFSAYINWSITPKTRFNTNLFANYRNLKDGSTLNNHGWNGGCYASLQQSFTHDWRLTLSYYGRSGIVSLQGKGQSYSDYVVNLQKSLLNKRLTLTAFAGSFLQKYKRRTSTLEGTGFTQTSWNKTSDLRYGIGVSVRLGELKASVKKAERTISNDDVKKGN